MSFPSFIAAWLLLSALVVAQQMIQPTNVTSQTLALNTTQLFLQFKTSNMQMTFGVDWARNPATFQSGADLPLNINQTGINGELALVNPLYPNNLTAGDIAYMSCDASSYNTNNTDMSPDDTLNMVTGKVNGGQNEGDSAGAIILYSTTALWCNFTPPASYAYQNVYILPNSSFPEKLEETLKAPNATTISARILANETSAAPNNGTSVADDSNDLGPTPTTTVAMIILYSVTGIITLCFIVVIITGAVRAHRHPDRYGLMNITGGSHQRRARALGRALLDTIPIVKFSGAREPSKPVDTERGMELGNVETDASPGAQHSATSAVPMNAASPDTSTEAANAGNAESTPLPASDSQREIEAADAGLACSVCTDDFVKGQDLRVLPCNHKFHPECIDPWLLNVSGTCPLCRVDLHPVEQGDHPSDTDDTQQSQITPERVSMGPDAVPIYRPLRFSTLLNPRRMRNATPEQRVRALREHRNARRASNGDASTDVPPVPRIRGTRLTRLFRRDTTTGTQTTQPSVEARSHQAPDRGQSEEGDAGSNRSGTPPSNSRS